MKYLLDSNTRIRYLNGRSLAVVRRIKITPPDQIAICSVVKAELYFGAKRSTHPVKTRTQQDEFLALFISLPFDDSAAEFYSDIRAQLTAQGTPIGPYDLKIAAIARSNQLTLVVQSQGEVGRIG